MADLPGPNIEVFRGEFPKYLKRVDGRLNSESADRQFGQSDVYDNSIMLLNRNRGPGSRARGKGNASDGKRNTSERPNGS